jgi:two-component system phosphate regulon response regulator PhoB
MRSAAPSARPKAKILYVEDDLDLQKNVSFILWKEGYQILSAESGGEAIELARREKPDLILLDLLLPGLDGYKVCKVLKRDAATADIAIIMVTARTQVKDIVAGLKDFADDYITKPFEPEILLARIRALLRRRIKLGEPGTSIIRADDLVIRPEAYEVLVSGRKVLLSKTEFDILTVLAGKPNQVFSRSRILDSVREDGYPVTERVVDYHITGLRRKMGKAGKYIQTVRGVGYKFDAGDNI